MPKPEYTINKIYFTIADIEDFTAKYDNYFLKLDETYQTSTYSYKGIHYYNIQLDFQVNMLSEKKFNKIMDAFCDSFPKNPVKRASYKYYNPDKNDDEIVHKWINRNE